MPSRRLFAFPNPVDEVSARLVAGGAAVMAITAAATGWWPLYLALVYGFAARVAAGPRFSPLALLATRVVRPRLPVEPRLVPGPPKRFAQSIGLLFSSTALVLLVAGLDGWSQLVLVLLAGAATLEAVFALCLGCKAFALLMRAGIIPASVCEECSDLSARFARSAEVL